MSEQHNIEKTYSLPYPQAVVYAAWVSSSTVIPPATAMDIDAVVGGHYRLIMESDAYSGRNEGEFIEIVPGEFLHYTWEWNADGNISNIRVRFSSDGDDYSQVHLVHSGFVDAAAAKAHADGWDSYIAGFERHLAKRRNS